MSKFFLAVMLYTFCVYPAYAKTINYELTLDYGEFATDAGVKQGMLVNGSYPAPVLYFNEGDEAVITVKNNMTVHTSIHWHGLLVPPEEDGVPYLSNFPIPPKGTYTYKFTLKHSGTYWYHSHTDLQEQLGLHGGIVVQDSVMLDKIDYDEVFILQDWIDENPKKVLHNLKKDGDYYALKKNSVVSILGYLKAGALRDWFKSRWIKMGGMDVSDIGYDAFFINGKSSQEIFTDMQVGETIRLRFVNSGASSYFYVHASPELDLKVIAADGNYVQPFIVNEILQSPAETYDVLVTLPKKGSFEIRSSSQDGTGHASIFIGSGEKYFAIDKMKPNPYAMNMDHSSMKGEHHHHMNMADFAEKEWSYKKLKSKEISSLPNVEVREIDLRLTGDMASYNWSFDNIPLSAADKIKIKRGEVVRFNFINETMMHHPLHLHGHFFRVLTGNGEHEPLKHTVNVPPMEKVSIEFFANERKDWFFHCHNLYHAKTGMARVVSYEGDELDPKLHEAKKNSKDISDTDFYYKGNIKALNDLGFFEASYFNRQHAVDLSLRSYDYDLTIIELDYLFNISRWGGLFVGIEEFEGEVVSRVGAAYTLPFLIDSRVYVTDEGDLEISLESEFQLSKRTQAHMEFGSEEYYHYGIEYRLNNVLSLEVSYSNIVAYSVGGKLRF